MTEHSRFLLGRLYGRRKGLPATIVFCSDNRYMSLWCGLRFPAV